MRVTDSGCFRLKLSNYNRLSVNSEVFHVITYLIYDDFALVKPRNLHFDDEFGGAC